MKVFYIELKYKNKIDIIGEFLVKSEDEVTAIKDVMQNIKEINPSVVNSVLPNFVLSTAHIMFLRTSKFYAAHRYQVWKYLSYREILQTMLLHVCTFFFHILLLHARYMLRV